MTFGLDEFARGFVAALVELDQQSIQPKSPDHLRSMSSVRDFVEAESEGLRLTSDKAWFRDVVRLRNGLSPGQTGSFDQFETALRDLQLSFTESPNPNYEDIVFTVSRPFARSTLDAFEPRARELVKRAAAVFVGKDAKVAA